MPLNRAFMIFPGWSEGSDAVPQNVELGTRPARLGKRLIQRKTLSFELQGISQEQYTDLKNLKGASIADRYGKKPRGEDLYIEGCSLENAVFGEVTLTKVISVGGTEMIDCRVEYYSLNPV
ncbi:MAG: hypothetical protein F6K28_17135 [Microcoleus sp. SIO2G3]|nr:hypothetical protein [Microcoleus sp. SIO2G3]